jgi:hypothetical protein
MTEKDYAGSGLNLANAFKDRDNQFGWHRERTILWQGARIYKYFWMPAPLKGRVRAEFLANKQPGRNGFDMKVDKYILLPSGKKVKTLRTMDEPELDPVVEYEYHSKNGEMAIYNVFLVIGDNGYTRIEHSTGNSGMIVEQAGELEYLFRCSSYNLPEPDFDDLVFKVKVWAI